MNMDKYMRAKAHKNSIYGMLASQLYVGSLKAVVTSPVFIDFNDDNGYSSDYGISADELYEDIYAVPVKSIRAEATEEGDTAIIVIVDPNDYINSVLKNPAVPQIEKDMLKAYQKIINEIH